MSRRPRPSPEDTENEESFVTRWSRRKEDSRTSTASDELPDLPQDESEEPLADTGCEKTDEDMPPIDSIDENSDLSEFFSPGVSETLRKAALRKLFHSPAFNIVDGLDDYDDDFTVFEALGDLVTSDMRHQEELAEERKRALEEQQQSERLSEEDVSDETTVEEDLVVETDDSLEESTADEQAAKDEEDPGDDETSVAPNA